MIDNSKDKFYIPCRKISNIPLIKIKVLSSWRLFRERALITITLPLASIFPDHLIILNCISLSGEDFRRVCDNQFFNRPLQHITVPDLSKIKFGIVRDRSGDSKISFILSVYIDTKEKIRTIERHPQILHQACRTIVEHYFMGGFVREYGRFECELKQYRDKASSYIYGEEPTFSRMMITPESCGLSRSAALYGLSFCIASQIGDHRYRLRIDLDEGGYVLLSASTHIEIDYVGAKNLRRCRHEEWQDIFIESFFKFIDILFRSKDPNMGSFMDAYRKLYPENCICPEERLVK